jgi:hypothetical protein
MRENEKDITCKCLSDSQKKYFELGIYLKQCEREVERVKAQRDEIVTRQFLKLNARGIV